MTTLFRYMVFDTVGVDGLHILPRTAQPLTVNGTPMARIAGGAMLPAEGWFADKAGALADAAATIESRAELLRRQAAAMRAEAAALVTGEGT